MDIILGFPKPGFIQLLRLIFSGSLYSLLIFNRTGQKCIESTWTKYKNA